MDSLLGRTISFIPNVDCEPRFCPDERTVKGTVIYENRPHHFFTVAFMVNGYLLTESFHYTDIGEGVIIL